MQRYVYEGPLSAGELVTLSSEESHHITKVLRHEPGDHILLVTGTGEIAQAELVSVHAKKCVVKVGEIRVDAHRAQITLAIGIAKGPALDFIVHRGTEIGVAAFQPLVTHHSLKASGWNEARWRRVVVEVCKQCEASQFPKLLPPESLGKWLGERSSERPLIVCHEKIRHHALPEKPAVAGCDLVIGAEGGWSDEETHLFESHRAVSLGLGSHRLRAETAALVALTLVKKWTGEI